VADHEVTVKADSVTPCRPRVASRKSQAEYRIKVNT
jgi:hypothetical protein